jgi:ATP-dependent DNA helicase RecG
MIKETDGEKYEDVRSLNQELTFNDLKKEFSERKIEFGAGQQRTLGLMNADGIYTNLGLLFSDQCIHTVKLAVFDGIEKAIFKDRWEFTGSLISQLNESYKLIDRYNRNRSVIDGLHRIDNRDYPIEAVREALLNALVHRDYSFSDSTLISIFDDRIEFVNIGGLVRGISYNDMMIGVSVARNRSLANVFYRLTLIEAYGTGIPSIIRSYKSCDAKPVIEVTDNAYKITLPNINEANKKTLLSENEKAVVDLYGSKDFIFRKDIEEALSVSQSMAVRILKGLLGKDKIRIVGNGKQRKYVLNG